ncbi:MAG: phosphoribosylaminoimidazolesuccinocarboxamide synthase [Actinomycetota bacterium]
MRPASSTLWTPRPVLGLELITTGKVRELYAVGEDRILMVATDRLSAFDVVMGEAIPDKGRVLTAMSAFWYEELADLGPSAYLSCDPEVIEASVPGFLALEDVHGRAMLMRRADMLPLECIVRGRLAGQAFSEYAASGTIHGEHAPQGLKLADSLGSPQFTPSTKAEEGHDLNIGFAEAIALVGSQMAEAARSLSLAIFERAAERIAKAGLVLADSKFELGLIDGELVLCDEVVTPDSSRIWPADQIVSGETPPAFDKQPFRDWLETLDWDKQAPPPVIPDEVVEITGARYREAYERVTGLLLKDWYGRSQ